MNKYIPRQAESKLSSWLTSGKVLLLLGARQVGKTTLLKNFLDPTRTLYLNLDIEVEKQKLLSVIPLDPQTALRSLGAPEILVIDEAQRLPEISRVVKGWYDAGVATKLILSGSSSLHILSQSAEALTGRNEKIFLPPLTFAEILSSQSWYRPGMKELEWAAFGGQIKALLLSCLVFGGYPEVFVSEEKVKKLNNLSSDYLFKDILQFGLVKTPSVIQRLLFLLAHQVGSLVSINELANNLTISRSTVERFLDLLEQTFVIFRLPAYSTNPRKEIAKSQKIYFWDTGVRNALVGELGLNPLRSDLGRLWESWVVAEFAKKNLLGGNLNRLYFWRSRTGSEVDLVIKKSEGPLQAYEIKWSATKTTTRAFTSQYHLPLQLVNPENVVFYLI